MSYVNSIKISQHPNSMIKSQCVFTSLTWAQLIVNKKCLFFFECKRQCSDKALPLAHRYRAGAFMSMALGGVRWDTVQWTEAVALESDSIVFESTREKVQGRGYHKWGAPRIGPGGTDWGAAFYNVWLQVERPSGCDWLLPAAQCPRGQRFAIDMPFDVSKKATFNSALSMFRCMLRGPGLNFDMTESLKYAFHSLRAWLDTGLR